MPRPMTHRWGKRINPTAVATLLDEAAIHKMITPLHMSVELLPLGLFTEERDALHARIEAMERQGPVAWLHETRCDSDVVTDAVKHVWGKVAVGSMAAYSIPLYALPVAKGEEK